MLLSAKQQQDSSADLYFRNGFVLAEANQVVMIRDGWRRTELGGLALISHPETKVLSASDGGTHMSIIGLAFDPERAIYDEAEVLAGLLEDLHHEDAFLTSLDRLAGRFAVVIRTESGTEVYQDAMGSRSVFYSISGPAVAASHAELVREIIGSSFSDLFIPFIQSKNYIQRDVKYLPGVATSYDDVLQLTPNTKLVMPEQRTVRFWPREPIGGVIENDAAAATLVGHLEGMAGYLKYQSLRPVIGLTAGTDSRGVFAAVKDLDPYIFTYVRSMTGTGMKSEDSRVAAELAERYDLQANVWAIPNRVTLNSSENDFSHAFRLATGYYRGAGSPWLKSLNEIGEGIPNGVFVRGFGGEVMRGFYQAMSKRIRKLNLYQVCDAYDVNSGSDVTRRLFADMMERTDFTVERIAGYDPNDIFYWEHRMGTWGSIALTEADLAMPAMVGYNSRNLYTTFMRLSETDRSSRVAFDIATAALAPRLESVG